MFHLVLFQPEIPPNTGNVIRLAANTGVDLHLIEPLGFDLDEPRLKRAGLDYREVANVKTHTSLPECLESLGSTRVYAFSTRGERAYHEPRFEAGDTFVFGPETRGLPDAVLESLPEAQRLRLPMRPDSRSLNLSKAVAPVVYEAWRQNGFAGGR